MKSSHHSNGFVLDFGTANLCDNGDDPAMTIASFSNASQIMVSLRTIEDEFLNQRRILIEVAVTDPAWFDHEVHNSRPGQARRTVRPGLEVNPFPAFQLTPLKLPSLTLQFLTL